MNALPPEVVADARRVLDRAARRLLTARLESDAVGATAGAHNDAVEDGGDEGTVLLERELIPVPSGNGDGGLGGGD